MSKFKVLIVDDAGLIRDLIRKALRQQFPAWQISEEINGLKARQTLKKANFDLILCDWEMPEMSGAELLAWYRNEHQGETPFIMVTSRGDKAHVVKAIQAGVSNYLVKPFNNQQLIDKISTTLSKQGINLDAHRKFKQETTNSSVDALTAGKTLQKTPKPKPQVNSGSIDALTQPRSLSLKQQAHTAGSINALTQGKAKSAAPKKAKKTAKTFSAPCQIRLSNGETLNCVIKNATLKAITVITKADNHIPKLLEQAVVDIELAAENFARINGFIQALETAEPNLTPSAIIINFQIVDDDGVKMAQLSKFIADNR